MMFNSWRVCCVLSSWMSHSHGETGRTCDTFFFQAAAVREESMLRGATEGTLIDVILTLIHPDH